MASPLRLIIDFLAYEGLTSNDPEDSIKIKKTLEESDVTEVFRRKEKVADSTTDQSVPLPDASSDYLLIFSDQEISIKLNGSSDSLTLKPKSAGVKAPVYFTRGTISGLSISNASGNEANVDIISANI